MSLEPTTKRTKLAVYLGEAKEHLRITDDDSDHNERVNRLIVAATEQVEQILGAKLTPYTMQLTLDGFPRDDKNLDIPIDLRVYPVNSITTFVYDDSTNTETSMTLGTDYWEDLNGRYPKLSPLTSWPSAYPGKPASVRVTMEAGYADHDDVPEDIRQAILYLIKEMFDYGSEWVMGTHATYTNMINKLLFQHKRLSL